MCAIVDSCCLAMVFDRTNKEHPRFEPLFSWISGSGCLIYGGTGYRAELEKLPRYLALIVELRKSRHAVSVSDSEVDKIAAELKKEYPDPRFNDPHIVALALASGCQVVCTNDATAINYLKRLVIFNGRGLKRPSIYRGHKSHHKLCCDKKIVGACRDRG